MSMEGESEGSTGFALMSLDARNRARMSLRLEPTMKRPMGSPMRFAAQAASNTEQQFAMGDFKDVFTDIIIEGQEAHNNIANQLLKDERVFAAMQGMLAKMVYQAFAQREVAR